MLIKLIIAWIGIAIIGSMLNHLYQKMYPES